MDNNKTYLLAEQTDVCDDLNEWLKQCPCLKCTKPCQPVKHLLNKLLYEIVLRKDKDKPRRSPGRPRTEPKYTIPETIEHIRRSNGQTIQVPPGGEITAPLSDVARIMHVSERTVRRKVLELNGKAWVKNNVVIYRIPS